MEWDGLTSVHVLTLHLSHPILSAPLHFTSVLTPWCPVVCYKVLPPLSVLYWGWASANCFQRLGHCVTNPDNQLLSHTHTHSHTALPVRVHCIHWQDNIRQSTPINNKRRMCECLSPKDHPYTVSAHTSRRDVSPPNTVNHHRHSRATAGWGPVRQSGSDVQ